MIHDLWKILHIFSATSTEFFDVIGEEGIRSAIREIGIPLFRDSDWDGKAWRG